MALLPDREVRSWDVTKTMTTVCEPGQFVCHVAVGSGASIGDTGGTVGVVALISSLSRFAGVTELYHVNLDTTHYDLNRLKGEQLINKAGSLIREGFVVTNMISGTPKLGDHAFLANNGLVTNSAVGGSEQVGKFESTLDENGYAKVRFSTNN